MCSIVTACFGVGWGVDDLDSGGVVLLLLAAATESCGVVVGVVRVESDGNIRNDFLEELEWLEREVIKRRCCEISEMSECTERAVFSTVDGISI